MKTKTPKFISNKIILSPKTFRIGLIMAMLIYSTFGVLDYYTMSSNYEYAWAIRYAIILPLLITTFFISYYEFFYLHSKIILLLILCIGQLGIIAIMGLSEPEELAYSSYYVGLILILLWASIIFRISFKATIYNTISTIILYNINVLFIQQNIITNLSSIDWTILLNNNFFLIFSSLLIIIAAYQFDKNLKENASVNSELQNEKEQLKIAKEKIEESESNLTAIIKNSMESIWSINTKYEIQYVNEIFANSFYYTFGVKLAKGINLLESIPENLKPLWKERYDRAFNNEHFVFEDKIDLEGSPIYIEVAMNPIIVDSKVTGASFYGRDITSMKLNELQLIIAKEKAEESDKLKSSFLANMSHEIRTPMNSIIGFANLLRNENLTSEYRNTFISYIQNNGEILLELINDIIDISKIESSQLSIKLEQVFVNDLLDEIVAFYAVECIHKGGCDFKLNIPLEMENLSINTDRVRLRQVLNNLIDNAIKYGKDKIEFGYTLKNENFIEFYVKDNGDGISKDHFDLIFERFSQLDYIPNIGGIKGVGLGLSICKLIAEHLNAEIWLESEIGVGSTFYFKIPIR